MDEYAGRVLADRYRLPLPPSDEFELAETRAFDTYSGQEVLVRQVPLPEVVDAEVLDEGAGPGVGAGSGVPSPRRPSAGTTRRPTEPAVRRAMEAAQSAAQIPDHPRLDQVFDVFAEGGSLWVVSELVAARPLAALLAEKPLNPYRAAEIAADVLTALRVLHAHGWTHRNITARTVLVCEDGRVVLTGLASGAAEEALCGYDPVPAPDLPPESPPEPDPDAPPEPQAQAPQEPDPSQTRYDHPYGDTMPAQRQAPAAGASAEPGADTALPALRGGGSGDIRAARAGAIAAYRAGTRAAARVSDVERQELAGHWYDAEPRPRDTVLPSQVTEQQTVAGGWNRATAESVAPVRRGPATPLAAERARQARIAVVGPVTERWAPEQAGPVHENWQLAAPVGPATDLWALGALLFRSVQGHAPYPEESAAELVQLVCAEPPAFAEECGPLRPVVESLLRQDPTERPDMEELRGWLRSLVRSAPEPDAGQGIVPVPAVDAARLPIVRRRGELVRRRRNRKAAAADVHGRHRQRKRGDRRGETEAVPSVQAMEPVTARRTAPQWSAQPRGGGQPRSLGRTLVIVILVVLIAALVYALKFMPEAGTRQSGSSGAPTAVPTGPATGASAGTSAGKSDTGPSQQSQSPGEPQGTEPDSGGPAAGYAVRKDPEGFSVAVDKDWERRPVNDAGQIRYLGGDFELIVVPGRDSVKDDGADPMAYQRNKERELKPFRDSTWSSAAGLRRIDVGTQAMAEGQFTWQDSSGREVFVRNVAMIISGRYHIVQVIGPESQRDKVTEIYDQAVSSYHADT
ncbi:protein kinase [Streptomyces sp. NPDC051320]|uniref:protein kinase n=1 Tax=Streptomyces sp. NPDC051320 TaxID=3154644 RepID=UPI0034307E13